jgi:uncharacterized protein YdhG (YjbR/CyaY superfamily)
MEKKTKPADIDNYIATIAAASTEAAGILRKIRRLIKAKVPDATETIAYQMPAFRRKNVFIYFAAFKHHVGIYPPVRGDKALQKELLPYRGENGNLKFPLDEEMPYDLIARVALALSTEYGKQAE